MRGKLSSLRTRPGRRVCSSRGTALRESAADLIDDDGDGNTDCADTDCEKKGCFEEVHDCGCDVLERPGACASGACAVKGVQLGSRRGRRDRPTARIRDCDG